MGRTVLKWFPDKSAETTPRVLSSSRKYFVHIAGVELHVEGLAWQQQDTGVAACATISLWSMLHSSLLTTIMQFRPPLISHKTHIGGIHLEHGYSLPEA